MKPTPFIWLLFAPLHLGATTLTAQNLLFHNDGVQEAFSRGPGPIAVPLTVIQRFPEEQWCGRRCLECVTVELQDLTPLTPEPFSIEVRKGVGAANLPTDTPDMTAAGLLCAPAFAVKPPGPARLTMQIPVGPCCPLPPGVDVYLCVVSPPPGDLQVWYSNNEAHRAPGSLCLPLPARYGPSPDLGLSWVYDPSGPTLQTTLVPLGVNAAWAIGGSVAEDVCQAFASGPPPVGPANYGYVGIYPDLIRVPPGSDAIGFRLRTTHPPGSPSVLLLGVTKLLTPIDLSTLNPFFSGFLCVDPILLPVALTVPGGGPCISVSESVFGPFPMPVNLCGLDVCAQIASIDPIPNTLRLSTACLVDL